MILFATGCKLSNNEVLDSSASLEAISLIREAHVKAVNTTDVESLLRDMSSDVVYLAPGIDPIVGEAALREFVTPIYELVSPSIEMIPSNIEIHDSVAIEWGIINGEVRQQDTDSVQYFKNKYVFVYEQTEEGNWLITTDIYNDLP